MGLQVSFRPAASLRLCFLACSSTPAALTLLAWVTQTGPVNGIYWCMAVGSDITGASGSHFNEIFAHVMPEVRAGRTSGVLGIL
jgi:hypothetical protein